MKEKLFKKVRIWEEPSDLRQQIGLLLSGVTLGLFMSIGISDIKLSGIFSAIGVICALSFFLIPTYKVRYKEVKDGK